MADGYSRSPKLLKGALVELAEPFLGPIPNIIIFQYNPESISRGYKTWAPPAPADNEAPGAGPKDQAKRDRNAPFDPEETFDLALELDATDALEEPDSHPVAVIAGIADRLAALEMLVYPMADANSVLAGALGGPVPKRGKSKIVLFVWGPGRIVPVRVQKLSIDEQQFSPLLYPLRAKVSVGLVVLPPSAFADDSGIAKDLAIGAYKFTRAQKELLAVANLANSVESILGMLPF